MRLKTLLSTGIVTTGLFAATSALATPIAGPRSVGSFYTNDDTYLHAIVAQTNDALQEVYFVDGEFVDHSVIATFASPIVATTGYYTNADGLRHAIALLANGQLWEVYFNPRIGIFKTLLTTLPSYAQPISTASWSDSAGTGWVTVLWGYESGGTTTALYTQIYSVSNHTATTFQWVGDPPSSSIVRDTGGTFLPTVTKNVIVDSPQMISANQAYFGQYAWWGGLTTMTFYGPNPLPKITIDGIRSYASIPMTEGSNAFPDVLALDDDNRLIEVNTGTYAGANIPWVFTYGPTTLSVGACVDPLRNKKHAMVMMNNGDLWDMYAANAYAGAWSYVYLGRY